MKAKRIVIPVTLLIASGILVMVMLTANTFLDFIEAMAIGIPVGAVLFIVQAYPNPKVRRVGYVIGIGLAFGMIFWVVQNEPHKIIEGVTACGILALGSLFYWRRDRKQQTQEEKRA
jgi:hypothetical protein